MDKKINKMVQEYQLEFKNSIKKWMEENKVRVVFKKEEEEDKTSELLKYVFDYNTFEITKEDLQKRKRAKNTIPQADKCIAKRSNGHQCTRRKKTGSELLCGTHLKGTPHGVCSETIAESDSDETNCEQKNKTAESSSNNKRIATKIEIWIQEIKGINYYIDNVNNVYKTEDIIANKPNPEIIAKWKLNTHDKYTIPEFGI
jgi:hypothetical protein